MINFAIINQKQYYILLLATITERVLIITVLTKVYYSLKCVKDPFTANQWILQKLHELVMGNNGSLNIMSLCVGKTLPVVERMQWMPIKEKCHQHSTVYNNIAIYCNIIFWKISYPTEYFKQWYNVETVVCDNIAISSIKI